MDRLLTERYPHEALMERRVVDLRAMARECAGREEPHEESAGLSWSGHVRGSRLAGRLPVGAGQRLRRQFL